MEPSVHKTCGTYVRSQGRHTRRGNVLCGHFAGQVLSRQRSIFMNNLALGRSRVHATCLVCKTVPSCVPILYLLKNRVKIVAKRKESPLPKKRKVPFHCYHDNQYSAIIDSEIKLVVYHQWRIRSDCFLFYSS